MFIYQQRADLRLAKDNDVVRTLARNRRTARRTFWAGAEMLAVRSVMGVRKWQPSVPEAEKFQISGTICAAKQVNSAYDAFTTPKYTRSN
jgi:hypothetical protein